MDFQLRLWPPSSATYASLGRLAVYPPQNQLDGWKDILLVPIYAAGLSLSVLVLHGLVILLWKLFKPSSAQIASSNASGSASGIAAEFKVYLAQNGGVQIFLWKLLRFLGTLALFGLSIASVLQEHSHHGEGTKLDAMKKKKHRKEADDVNAFDEHDWIAIAYVAFYGYTTTLALWALVANIRRVPYIHVHLGLILFATWAVFFYRDVWPLGTYDLTPLDIPYDPLFWPKFFILNVVGLVVPLLIPNPYIPVDPNDPSEEPAPEQTASLLSFMMFSFLDPLRAFKHLDPFISGKKRHVIWGFASFAKMDYVTLCIMISLKVVCSFLAPIGVNRLLAYIETGGRDATVRPWVWIVWLAAGPLLGSIAMQWYIFVATRLLVRVESFLTELVFEHSLRIRMKEEAPATTPTSTPTASETATVVDSDEEPDSPDGSDPATVVGSEGATSRSGAKGKKPIPPSRTASVASTKGPSPVKKDESKEANLVGKINNLVTSDLNNITEARDFLFLVLYCPLQISICIWFLYIVLGWAAFVGLATMIATFPAPGWIASKVNTVSNERMKKTDARIQNVTEMMGLLRMIKLFGWESKINERLREKREDELVWIKKGRLLNLLNMNLNYWIPLLTMCATYATYTIVMKQPLSASVVFSSMAVFEMLRDQLHITFWAIPTIIQAKVSFDRLTDFLNNTELLDRYTQNKDTQINIPTPDIAEDVIGFNDAAFRWATAPPTSGTSTPGSVMSTGTGKRNFRLRIDGQLTFKRDALNLIVGPTGCGKTSLLLALIGELHFEPEHPSSWYQLPRDGGVAYAAQEAWVLNETIRENILFGAPYDEERYNKVIHQCGLERDLSLFDAGDKTEVGEKGLTLSGGQKARVTLARAIYSSAKVVLLDDVLAALDVHTAKWIVEKCFRGDLVTGRTIILVTHNVVLVSDLAQFVVSLSIDGRILSRGSISEALLKDKKLLAEVEKAKEENKAEEEVIDEPKPDETEDKPRDKKADGKLIVAEEIEEGHVSWPALNLYFQALGGAIFWVVFLSGMFGADLLTILQTYFLGYWARQYEEVDDPQDVPVQKFLAGYAGLLIVCSIVYSIGLGTFMFGAVRASRSIHNKLIDSILGTTLRWLDVVPTSRVIARTTTDLRSVDGPLSGLFSDLIELGISIICKFVAVVYMSPIFIFPGMVVTYIGWWCGQLYIASQLSVKREMSNSRAPVLGHFGAAIHGLTSIRAYGAEGAFKHESMKRIDKYTRAARSFYNLNRWICIRVDAIGGLFAGGLAAFLVYGQTNPDAGRTGFSLVMAVTFSGMILWFVRVLNMFEVEGNSLERIQQYVTIEQEPKPTEEGKPPAYWPASGNLRVQNLEAKYSSDGPLVLKDVNFELKSGERVGVVGRTGSGKSSLTLSLLRCIFTSGNVYYDGVDTGKINLDALRGNITIIPQQPELLSGTLRQNLDPFEQHDDAFLNDALRASGLFSLQEESEDGRITLDSAISMGGGNLSLGQRQILALARAITRRSKILILDEATAAVDYATDTAIQESIRKELKDVTLITVAHRLRTIMDADKIMVLDSGRLVEFDAPIELLKKKTGLLRSLVDESADKDELIEMAENHAKAKASTSSS
ncbi:ATP-binding cassette transporter [Auriculariales sp. MPI-PUGE-AT-0066]|nr:ATP-binding cassette transporter [Auriculariales sp. MPI-PUGE-AT-0066]